MDNDTHESETRPKTGIDEPLTDLLRCGARDLLKQVVEAGLQSVLDDIASHRLPDDRQAVVPNAHQLERRIQTGIVDVLVGQPKTRDRSGAGLRFHSGVLPPYLRRTRSIEKLLPWLYLKRISTGDFAEALTTLLGDGAAGLSGGTLSRLKRKRRVEYDVWHQRDLSIHRYLYWSADGVHFYLRGEETRACLLVVIGALSDGAEEFVVIDDGGANLCRAGASFGITCAVARAWLVCHSWRSAMARWVSEAQSPKSIHPRATSAAGYTRPRTCSTSC